MKFFSKDDGGRFDPDIQAHYLRHRRVKGDDRAMADALLYQSVRDRGGKVVVMQNSIIDMDGMLGCG